MKRFLALIMVAVMLTATSFSVLAEDATPVAQTASEEVISVMLDGNYIEFDVQPALINDRTMVPVRAIFEALGASVEWIEETQTVVSEMGDTKVTLAINNTVLNKNGEEIILDVPAQLVGTRTLVPLRAISEAYGCTVMWNGYKNTAVIVSDLDTTGIITVNDETVSMAYFNYVLSQIEAYAMQSFNADTEYLKNSWNAGLGDTTFGRYIIDSALEQCVFTKSNAQAAKAKGLKLTEADEKTISDNCAYIVEQYKNYDENFLASMYTTEEGIKAFVTDNVYADKYYDFVMDEGDMSDKEIKKYLDDNYIRAKHILFSNVDMQTGMPLSEEEVAAKKKLAEQTLETLRKKGNFDKLMEELSEDPGSKAQPEGYLFTKGDMVQSFEKAAYALKVDGLSGIVESEYGYHIIKRVKNGEYTESDILSVKEFLVNDKITAAMNSNKANAKLTSAENMIDNVIPVGLD